MSLLLSKAINTFNFGIMLHDPLLLYRQIFNVRQMLHHVLAHAKKKSININSMLHTQLKFRF